MCLWSRYTKFDCIVFQPSCSLTDYKNQLFHQKSRQKTQKNISVCRNLLHAVCNEMYTLPEKGVHAEVVTSWGRRSLSYQPAAWTSFTVIQPQKKIAGKLQKKENQCLDFSQLESHQCRHVKDLQQITKMQHQHWSKRLPPFRPTVQQHLFFLLLVWFECSPAFQRSKSDLFFFPHVCRRCSLGSL